jgi:hypothetical protein
MPETKAAKHAGPKHHQAKDLRRAYEHLGRVEAIQQTLPPSSQNDIHTLVTLAEKELNGAHNKDAADLLRAAEHLSFAALAETDTKKPKLSEQLETAITEELEHLTRKASEHWDNEEESERHLTVTALFHRSLETSAKALSHRAYWQALELARAAEALAHVKKHGPDQLESGTNHPKLPKP